MTEGARLLALLDHDAWATDRVIDAAARLADAQLDVPLGNPDWTVRSGLAHVLDASAHWCGQLTARPATRIRAADLPDAAAMRSASRAVSASLRAYVGGLSERDLEAPHALWRGPGTRSAGDIVSHVVMHASHHRGEIAALLTTLGASPGDLDFLDYLFERPAGA
jgi:uncharacterized damage-inducible protein DinB